MTLPASTLPGRRDVRVLIIEPVSVDAFSSTTCDTGGAISAKLIHAMCDRLQVLRVHAMPMQAASGTNMIEFETGGDFPHKQLITESVCEHRTTVHGKLTVTGSGKAPGPQPATGTTSIDERPKSFFNCPA